MDDDRIIFASEYDNEGMKKGVDEQIKLVEELRANTIRLSEEIKQQSSEYRKNAKEIADLDRQMKSSINTTNDYYKSLETRSIALKKANETLLFQISDSKKTFQDSTKYLKDYDKALENTGKTHSAAGKAIEKFTSINHLAADAITHVKRQVVDVGLSIASGFAGVLLGVAIPSLVKYVEELFHSETALERMTKGQRLVSEVLKEGAKNAGEGVAKLDLYAKKLNDLSIPENERIKVAKEYNKVADETNKIDLKQINNLELINAQIAKQNELIIQRAIGTAALSKLTEAASVEVEKELKFREELRKSGLTEAQAIKAANDQRSEELKQRENIEKSLDDGIVKNNVRRKSLVEDAKSDRIFISKELRQALGDRDRAKLELEDQTSLLSDLISVDALTTKPGKPKKDKKEPENEFEKRLLELRERLAQITRSVFENDTTIRDQFAKSLDKQFGDIDKAIADKHLTSKQGVVLKALVTEINDIELKKGLDEFGKKRREALEKINDELLSVQVEVKIKQIANLRDEFEQERLTIELEYDKTITTIKKKQRETGESIDADIKKGVITKAEGAEKKTLFDAFFGDLLTAAGVTRTNKQLDLAFNIFEKTIADHREIFNSIQLGLSEEVTKDIDGLTKKYLSHEITYANYQKELTKILKKESLERSKALKAELEQELKDVEAQIAKTKDKQIVDKLEKQKSGLKDQINGLSRSIDTGAVNEDNTDFQNKLDDIVKYTQAIGALTDTIVSFWQKANEAEQQQLERSIRLQEKRVEAAQRIADRGNAEYLNQEQDRLSQLQVMQENAARRQIAINAVVQASQALVAFVTALAQGAKIGGPLGAIVEATALLGLLAAGYGIIKNLQNDAPKLYKGTKRLTRDNGEPAGKDTILAWLNENEAVIPADRNAEYHPAVEAIYDRTIPASVLNQFVSLYPKTNVPGLNYSRIGESAEMKINHDGKLIMVMSEQTMEMRRTRDVMESVDRRLKHFGLNINMDKKGFAMSFMEAIDQEKKDKNA